MAVEQYLTSDTKAGIDKVRNSVDNFIKNFDFKYTHLIGLTCKLDQNLDLGHQIASCNCYGLGFLQVVLILPQIALILIRFLEYF